nr:CPBP family intramembrane glutamic endopeptidase [Allomuricauda sp.]
MRKSIPTYKYFLWIFLLSVPFYAIGKLGDGLFPVGLPISALMVVCPTLALCIILSFQELRVLIQQSFELKSANVVGYLLAILTMPLTFILTFFVMRYSGTDFPPFQTSISDIAVLTTLFFIGSLLEEIGWTGYATNALLKKHSVLHTGLVVGVIWSIWHLIPYVQMGKESHWIFWECIASVLKRIAMVWLFMKYGRNVFIIILFHMQINLSAFVFPTMGSHYSPFYFSLVFLGIMATVLICNQVLGNKKSALKMGKYKKP